MEIVVFILLAAVWAIFLIPSFFNSRKEAPINSTQDFARNTARLNTVRVLAVAPEISRRRALLARRRRAITFLVVVAFMTLVAAILTGSVLLLGLNLVVDMLLGFYVALLYQVRRHPGAAAPVPAPEAREEQARVRVLAG